MSTETRTYRYQPPSTGEIEDFYPAPEHVQFRIRHDGPGYAISYRLSGMKRFATWGRGLLPPALVWERIEAMTQVGERVPDRAFA